MLNIDFGYTAALKNFNFKNVLPSVKAFGY